MSTLLSKLDRISHSLFNRSYGWTGLEIGCHAIHMAQVRKIDNRWIMAAVWSIEHPVPYTNEKARQSAAEPLENSSECKESFGWLAGEAICEHGLGGTLEQLENLEYLFQGSHCAATLSDGMIAYRELDLPMCELSETKSMILSEIAIETECDIEDLLAECWVLPQNRPRANTTSYGAVSLKRSTAMLVASDLLQAGFECQTLDAMPCAMARATSMVVPDSKVATLAIDLGYRQSTITLVQNGLPVLSRGLRNLGLIQLLEQIAVSFEISIADAQTLLFQSSSSEGFAKEADGFSDLLQQRLNGYLHSLSNEIDKTIHFANRSYRTMSPSLILLMGAGVRIPGVDPAIEHRVGLTTQCWMIDVSDNLFGNQHIATFAIAAGLSALAWETI